MPLHNYCKKCKAEVPVGENCPRCGNHLTKTGEHLSFQVRRLPVKDWFAWNGMLRVVLPVIGVILLATILLEAITEGAAGVSDVFVHGFFWTLMSTLGVLLAFTLLLLWLQGEEEVCYILDAKGVQAWIYLRNASALRLYARLTTPAAVLALQTEMPCVVQGGLTLVRKTELPWAVVKCVRLWPETGTVLLYRPAWWQALYIRCGEAEYDESVAFIRKKLGRKKGVWKDKSKSF